MNAKITVAQLFENREFEVKKVEQMTVLYPRVNSTEYHKFRKAHEGLTHHDTTVAFTVAFFKKADEKPTRDAIINHLRTTYIERNWKSVDEDNFAIQIAQFLGQLTFRGWSGLINDVTKVFESR